MNNFPIYVLFVLFIPQFNNTPGLKKIILFRVEYFAYGLAISGCE